MTKDKRDKLYLFIVFLLGFINWSIGYWSNNITLVINLNVTVIVLAIFYIAFLLFSRINFLYSIPVIFSLIFSIGVPNINLEHMGYSIIVYLGLLLVIAGFIYRIKRDKIKIKFNALGLGLLLSAISIFIPFLYTKYSLTNLSISLLGFVYLVIYLIFSNLISKKDNYHITFLIHSMMGASIFLLLQLGSHYYDQLTNFNDVHWYSKLITLMNQGWVGNFPRWGNINDLTIHLVLLSAAPILYLSRNKNKLWPWLYLLLTGIMIFISLSRGSMVTYFTLFIIISIYTIKRKRKHKIFFKNYIITVLIMILFIGLATDIVMVIFGLLKRDLPNLIDFENWNLLLTGRIEIYKTAIDRWLTNPLYFFFGGGWYGDISTIIVSENRILIYHSTFFQVLATGGLVGIGVLIYHFKEVYNVFRKTRFKIFGKAFLVTYMLTQIHGMLDNTQYMIHYMIVVLLIFSIIEPNNEKITNEDVNLA